MAAPPVTLATFLRVPAQVDPLGGHMPEGSDFVPVNAARLRELEAYTGSTPIPPDFDEFWARRRAEVRTMLPLRSELKELDSKTPGVKLFSVFLYCPRGITASGYFSRIRRTPRRGH